MILEKVYGGTREKIKTLGRQKNWLKYSNKYFLDNSNMHGGLFPKLALTLLFTLGFTFYKGRYVYKALDERNIRRVKENKLFLQVSLIIFCIMLHFLMKHIMFQIC